MGSNSDEVLILGEGATAANIQRLASDSPLYPHR